MIGEGEKNIKRKKQTNKKNKKRKKPSSFFVYSVDQSNKTQKHQTNKRPDTTV
jgi:hypothetical protein